MSVDRAVYDDLVAQFRVVLDLQSPESERCCLKVHEGQPDCCWTVAQNVSCLEFTSYEIDLLWPDRRSDAFTLGLPDEGLVLNRHGLGRWFTTPINPRLVSESLHRGLLAETIESASHPTRPIVHRGTVMGVASVNDCIAGWGLYLLLERRDELARLWQLAVDLIGEKAYYDRRGGLVTL